MDEAPIIHPPGSVTVDERGAKPVLYTAAGKPLARDVRIGFRPGRPQGIPRDGEPQDRPSVSREGE